MQKVIFVSEDKREEVEEHMESTQGLFNCDYIDYCQHVADTFKIDSSDAEAIYDDLFVNTERQYECAELYDEDSIRYDSNEDFYYVSEDDEEDDLIHDRVYTRKSLRCY